MGSKHVVCFCFCFVFSVFCSQRCKLLQTSSDFFFFHKQSWNSHSDKHNHMETQTPEQNVNECCNLSVWSRQILKSMKRNCSFSDWQVDWRLSDGAGKVLGSGMFQKSTRGKTEKPNWSLSHTGWSCNLLLWAKRLCLHSQAAARCLADLSSFKPSCLNLKPSRH